MVDSDYLVFRILLKKYGHRAHGCYLKFYKSSILSLHCRLDKIFSSVVSVNRPTSVEGRRVTITLGEWAEVKLFHCNINAVLMCLFDQRISRVPVGKWHARVSHQDAAVCLEHGSVTAVTNVEITGTKNQKLAVRWIDWLGKTDVTFVPPVNENDHATTSSYFIEN